VSTPRTGERVVVVVATLASFLTPFVGSATNVALPAIGREMHKGTVALSWVATAYLLSAAVFLVPFGRLADIHGRKRVFVGGLLVYTATSALCAVAPSFPFLLAGRVAHPEQDGADVRLLVELADDLQHVAVAFGLDVEHRLVGLDGPDDLAALDEVAFLHGEANDGDLVVVVVDAGNVQGARHGWRWVSLAILQYRHREERSDVAIQECCRSITRKSHTAYA